MPRQRKKREYIKKLKTTNIISPKERIMALVEILTRKCFCNKDDRFNSICFECSAKREIEQILSEM